MSADLHNLAFEYSNSRGGIMALYQESSRSLEHRVNDMLRRLPTAYLAEPSKEEEIADLIKLLDKAEADMRDAWLRADRIRRQLAKLRA